MARQQLVKRTHILAYNPIILCLMHKKREGPRYCGPSLQVQLRRISAQPHRCNGKSFQYPLNVIILLIIYFLWVCYSVVLVLVIMLAICHSAT